MAEISKIMTKPLPLILDEIEASIREADKAAEGARDAAEAARKAGEKAAGEAARVAAEKISEVQKTAEEALRLVKLTVAALKESAIVMNNKLDEKVTGKS
jgi:hypothetical protein